MSKPHHRFRNVIQHIAAMRRDVADPESALADGRVVVDGRIVMNPKSLVRSDSSVRLLPERPLRGEVKLRAALEAFGVEVTGRIALDIGASAGGFTHVLLEHGAKRVFAVDVGHGQLRGELRRHSRVVNLERTNLSNLSGVVPRCLPVGVVTIDLSYLSAPEAVPQLEPVPFTPGADLIALVKPMFELRLAGLPRDPRTLRKALDHAVGGIQRMPWTVAQTMASPVQGSHGANEWFVHSRRR